MTMLKMMITMVMMMMMASKSKFCNNVQFRPDINLSKRLSDKSFNVQNLL